MNLLDSTPFKLAPGPKRCGAMPVNIAVREAVHVGAATKALANKTPSRASRSNVGVLTTLSP